MVPEVIIILFLAIPIHGVIMTMILMAYGGVLSNGFILHASNLWTIVELRHIVTRGSPFLESPYTISIPKLMMGPEFQS